MLFFVFQEDDKKKSKTEDEEEDADETKSLIKRPAPLKPLPIRVGLYYNKAAVFTRCLRVCYNQQAVLPQKNVWCTS